ncbi:MAG: cobalamin biosynthesis protein P47K [Deltaproteobacteria bacterium]|nr:cobalamin biosynthesis protein P47K [Deltaproteobacteria bacterium]
MATPPALTVPHPVRLIFTGGFLGAGKTTSLAALARLLLARGQKVGIVTNDQSPNLADTVIVREMLGKLGVPVEEVVEGCFCCHFDQLVAQMDKVLASGARVLLGEPVGSCTDFVAAVANPIRLHYGDSFHFAPLSALVDPARVRELLLGENQTLLPAEVSYLFRKQLEEADLIVLNKVDTLVPDEEARLLAALQAAYPAKRVLAVSAREGRGVEEWLDLLLSEGSWARSVIAEIDYDTYAEAEAGLGWLNAAVMLSADQPWSPAELLKTLGRGLQKAFRDQGAEIGHLKFVLTAGDQAQWGNLTALSGEPWVNSPALPPLTEAKLVVNARVSLLPAVLEAVVRQELAALAPVRAEVRDLACFQPAYPNPPYLLRETPAQ